MLLCISRTEKKEVDSCRSTGFCFEVCWHSFPQPLGRMIEISSPESLKKSTFIRKAYGAKCGLTQDSGTVQYVDDRGVRGIRTFFMIA